jgi:hypothetical protein
MPRHALSFFLLAAFYGLLGAATGVYTYFSILGFATLAAMGAFYALARSSRLRILPWINLVLSALGVALYATVYAYMAIGAAGPLWVMLGRVAALLVGLGIATFALSVILAFFREPAPTAPRGAER